MAIVERCKTDDGIIELQFDNSEAEKMLMKALKTTSDEVGCSLSGDSLHSLAYELQQAIEWYRNPVETATVIKKLTKAANAFVKAKKFANSIESYDLVKLLDIEIVKIESQINSLYYNRVRRHFESKSENEKSGIDEFRNNVESGNFDNIKITDNKVKPLWTFLSRLSSFDEQNNTHLLASCLYRDHLPISSESSKPSNLNMLWSQILKKILDRRK